MRYYGREVSNVIGVLRRALKDLRALRDDYRKKTENAGAEGSGS
jgi:hypothetical protein